MLAMVVNDNAGNLTRSGVLQSIASMLAPTGEKGNRQKNTPHSAGYFCFATNAYSPSSIALLRTAPLSALVASRA